MKQQLCVLSFFRNSERNGQLYHFFSQLERLRLEWAGPLRAVLVWGDSVDRTRLALEDQASRLGLDATIVEHSHGKPEFGSTEAPERLQALTHLMNFGLDHIQGEDSLVWYVESDLIWSADIVPRLYRSLRDGFADIVAPMPFAAGAVYDIWGFRKDGQRFSPFPPYHPKLSPAGLTEVDSVGSALLINGTVARATRARDGRALVGFCDAVRAQRGRILVDAREIVRHPA
jgi:hypothetical protein